MSDEKRQDYLYDEIRSLEESVKDVSNKVNSLDKNFVEYKVSFDNHVSVDEKMYAELRRMNDILAENTESLKTHIRRTDALEDLAIGMNKRLSELEVKNIEQKAIKAWLRGKMMLCAKIIGALTGISALITAVYTALPIIAKWIVSLAG